MKKLIQFLLVAAFVLAVVQRAEAGKLRRLIYYSYNGSVITNLYGPNLLGVYAFPDSPDGADYLPSSSMGAPNPPFTCETAQGLADNYGSLIKGYLTAPETGNYVFWLSSDDEGQLFLTTDPADSLNPAKTNLLCWVSGYSGAREWTKYPEQQSVPVALEKGKSYYLEIRHKEGTGGDYVVLGWQRPSGALERPIPAWYFQSFRDTRWAEPDVEAIAGPVTPKTAGDATIYDGNWTVVYANVNLDPPLTYQWLRNGTPIPGATDAYYLFRAQPADNNSQWTVQVNAGGTIYTPAAGPVLVYVSQDKPTVVSAGPVPQNPTKVQVVFSEEVNPSTATNTANYTVTGATIQSATLAADGRTVTLDVGLLTPTRVYTLSINNVQDMAVPANTMDPASTNFVLADGSISYRIWYSSFATDLPTLRTWSTNTSTAPSYANNLFNEERLITTTSYGWNLVPLRDNYMGQMIGYLTAPETGNYKFAIASDDHSILYLGTNDLRSSKREICNYNGSTGHWTLGAQANQQSALIPLEAGKRYYIEAVYRDGTGGDGVTVAWQTPSGSPLPTTNPGTQTETEPFYIPAQYLSPFTATYGNVLLKTNLPATLSAAESTRPVLSVVADGSLPYTYQWFKNDTAIPGATASAYTLPFVRPADSGATFQVVVNNNFSSVTSVLTTLTVTSDTVKPTVASAGSLYKQTVEVRFSEPVTSDTAGNPANYILQSSTGTAVAVNSAVIDPADASHVTLQTAPMPDTDQMRLAVQNVADLSAAANVIALATNTFRANNFDGVQRINNGQAWSASAAGEQIRMTAGGSDIWGTSDQCLFLYKSVTGNFDYKVQGVSLPAVNSWCKMGLMGRGTLDAGSRNVFNPFTPVTPGQNTYSAQVRDTTGGSSTSSNDAGTPLNAGVQGGVAARPTILPYPSWVRIQRIGNTFYYYYSANGTAWTYWTFYDSTTSPEGALPNTIFVGVALTSHDSANTVDGVMASLIAVNDGALRFTLQPTNTTVVEGGNVTFAVTAAGSSPWFYQWLQNGAPVTDATNATYMLTRVPYSLNGAQFSCRLSNPYGEVITSTNAVLTITQDTNPPTVRYYVMPKINIISNEVRLLYSEPMNKTSAETVGNYQITTSPGGAPLSITSATLAADERTVILSTAIQTPGNLYKVVVNNVIDQACCPPNPIAANSTDYFYYAGSSGRFAQRSDGFIIMEAENATRNNTGTTPARNWELQTIAPGYSGAGYMNVTTVGGTTGGTTPISGGVSQGTGPLLEYDIVFTRAATNYTIWVRGWNAPDGQPAGNNDSIFVGIDGNLRSTGPSSSPSVDYSQMTGWSGTAWDWRSDASSGSDPMVLTNVAPGVHTIDIWQREDGTIIDKILIEPGVRSNAGNSTEPSQASANGGLGQPETWDWTVAPPAAPTISIVNPTANQAFPGMVAISLEVSVSGPSPIALVEYFNGATLIGSSSTAPFSTVWANVPEGLYTLTARVTDVLGYQTTSAAVSIKVDSTKPVAYAVGSLRGNNIGVYFTDLTGLDPVSATTPGNYTVNSGAINVTNVTLEPDNQAVILALDKPVSGTFSVVIQNVADQGFGPNVVDSTTLSSTVVNWPQNGDVGTLNATNSALFTDPIMPGFAQAVGSDGFYIHAGGHDIWDNADGCHFVYVPVTGNVDIAVRVAGVRNANSWSKAGLMIREDLEGSGRNVFIGSAPTNGQNVITAQWRTTKGTATYSLATAARPTPTPIPNCWVRLTRTNDVFSFYWGTNGTDWASLGSTNFASFGSFAATAYVGVAATSHDNTASLNYTTSAYFRNLTGIGMPPLPESPALAVQAVGSNLTISWTSTSASWKLMSNATLDPATWQQVPGAPTVNGNTYSVTVSALAAQQQFFRLVYTP